MYGEIVKDPQGFYHLTGEQRTGCIYCGFGVTNEEEPNRYQRLQVTHPKHYDLCMRPVQDGGLGMKRVLEYMEIPFETWESVGQMRMEFDKGGEMKAA